MKKIFYIVLAVALLAGLGWTAHTVDLAGKVSGFMRSIHGK